MFRTLSLIALLSALAFVLGVVAAHAREPVARRHAGCHSAGIPAQFDSIFRHAARRSLPVALKGSWCTLKALCWIESRLNPEARSHVGARGLCQVMPATAEFLTRRGSWRGRLRTASDNAEAGAQVLAWSWNVWTSPRSIECRFELAIAGYNAGPGSIVRAQTLSGGRRCWEGIRPHLPKVTGDHARETIDYVSRFWAAYRRLRGYGLR